jgi:hypothetical protein
VAPLSLISHLSPASPENAVALFRASYTFVLETFLCFLHQFDRDFCLSSSMFYRFIPPLFVLAPHDSNVAVYAQVCCLFWVLCHCLASLREHPVFSALVSRAEKKPSAFARAPRTVSACYLFGYAR